MYEALYLFLATGLVSMSAALSAGALNKLPEEQRPAFMQTPNGVVAVVMLGNLAALTLIGALAFGIRHMSWWIPLSCVFITFPVIHIVVIQRVLGDMKALLLMSPLVVASIVALWYFW